MFYLKSCTENINYVLLSVTTSAHSYVASSTNVTKFCNLQDEFSSR